MEPNDKFVTLEMACRSLKQQDVRLLKEIAFGLSSVAIPESEFNPDTIRYADSASQYSSPPITYRDVSSYFQLATGNYVPVLFETPERTVESCRVLVNRGWLERRSTHAREVLGLTALVSEATANQAVAKAQRANGNFLSSDQPPPLTSDALENLRLMLGQQNSQRKAQDAAGRETLARQAAEERAIRAEMLLLARDAELKVSREQYLELLDQKNILQHRLDDVSADAAYLEQQLESSFGLLEFVNPLNPESPPVGRQALECWTELTHSGSRSIMADSRRGTGEHIRKWLKAQDGCEPSDFKMKVFRLLLTPESRKQGGAVPSSKRKG